MTITIDTTVVPPSVVIADMKMELLNPRGDAITILGTTFNPRALDLQIRNCTVFVRLTWWQRIKRAVKYLPRRIRWELFCLWARARQ